MTTQILKEKRRHVRKVVMFDKESNGRCYWNLFIEHGKELMPFGHWVTEYREQMHVFAACMDWELRGEPTEETEPAAPVHRGCPND